MGNFHYVLFTIAILTIVLALSTSPVPVHAQTTSSIVLSGTQSTSGTVSSSPYQLTISNFNVGTGADRLLVVGVSANNANVASVTFGTSQLSQATSSFQNNDAEFWYLVNPAGTGNIVVTLSGSASAVVGAYSFSGVNQTSPIAGTAANYNPAGTPSSPTVSITTKYANDLVADLPSIYGGQLLGSPTCTQQWNDNVPSEITGASSTTTVPSPGTVTCSWTASNGGDQWDDVAIEVRASGTATAPSAPTALTATPGNGTVSLSWTAPSSNGGSAITGYNIYRGTTSGGEGATPIATGVTSTSYTDTGLTNGVTYYYTVKAVNSIGVSPASNEASATPAAPATVPGSPTGLAATGGNAHVSLSWAAPSSNGGSAIIGYNIYKGTTSGSETKYASVAASQTTYNDTSVTNGIKYYYEVTAVNAVGESAKSGEVSATPSAATYSISKTSSGLVVSDSLTNETETQQQLQSNSGYWTFGGSAPADKANYTIWRDTKGLHIGVQAPSNGTYAGYYALSKSMNAMLFHSVLTAPSQTLPAANVYYNNGLYVVSSSPGDSNYVTCASDTSSYGTVWALFFVTPTQYDRLWYDTSANQPLTRDCAIVTNGTNYLKLYMDGVPVYESNSLSLGMPSPFATYLEVQTSYNGSMLNSTYTDYYSTSSENVTVTNLPNNAATVSVTNSSGNILASSQVSGGNAVLAIGKYHLPLAGTINVYDSSNSLIISASENIYGGDVYSVSLNGPATAPSAPTALTSTPGNGTVSLSWTAPSSNGGSSITGYDVYRGTTSGGEGSTPIATGVTSTSYTDTGLTNGVTYYYTVKAVNSIGVSPASNEASATPATSPQPPTSLTATAASSSQINLSWTAPSSNGGSPITGYKIERSTDGTNWSAISPNTGSASTSYSDTGLSTGFTYYYRVSAINSLGTSQPSNTASATTQGGSSGGSGPVVLGNTQSTSGTVSASPYQLTISNYNVGTSTNRLLVVGVSANNANVASVAFGSAQLTKSASSFQNNDAEFWYLVNPAGTGNIVVTMSGATSAVVGAYSFSGVNQTSPIAGTAANYNPAGTPSSPTVSITTKYASDLVADLPSIYGGQLLGSPTCTQQWNANVPSEITGASSTMTVPSPGTVTCSWTASNGGDQWDDVAVEVRASGAPAISESAPSAPTALTATPGNGTVSLSWTAPSSNGGSAITGYNIYKGTTSGSETKYASVSASQTSYVDTAVTNGIKYYYEATAVNSIGVSPASNEASATPATSPQPPTSLTATAASSSQINLSWTAPSSNGGSPITGYKIERSTDSTNWSTISPNTGSASTSYSDTGLAASATYYYRVSAINNVGTSQPSGTSSATTQTSPPACTGTGPTMCLNTNSFNVGQDISVTGVNFTPNSQITFSFDNTAIGVGYQDVGSGSTSPLTVTTDSSGKFVGIMQPLRSVAGKHTVSAQDASKKTASQSVTILPHAYIFPTTAKPGQSILIPPSQGNGFAANSAITIKFDGTAITPSSSITTDSEGNFGGSFNVPATATTGTHIIVISDSKGDSYTIPSFTVDPNAHSFSAQVVATGLAPTCSYWPGCNDVPAYFAFIPDNGPGVDGSGAFMVNEKNSGNVFVFKYSNGQFVQQSVPFVKVPNVQVNYETNGLMGIALDPNWANATNPEKWVYLYVTRNQTVNGATTNNVIGEVIRYHATTDSSGDIIADPTTGEQVVLGNIPAWNNGHNGGGIKFDPHGNLVISTGDGWLFDQVSQNLASYQGKILRITPVYGSQVNGNWYTIPASNPYASSTNPVTQTIWAYGQRNPYAFDVDQKTGKIYISDTGYNTWEFISNATAPGSNDGWSQYERPPIGNPYNYQNYVPPMYWYSHQGVEPQTGPALGLEALSAGAFYHGTTYPGLDGAYIFGDYAVGKIEALLPSSVATPTPDPLTGVPVSKVEPLLYGLNLAPIYMEEWNGRMYFFDLYGNMYQLNYN